MDIGSALIASTIGASRSRPCLSAGLVGDQVLPDLDQRMGEAR